MLYFVYTLEVTVQVGIQKWGNSLGLRIPAKLASKLRLVPGTSVEIMVEGDHLLVVPRHHELDKLLALVTPENIHNEQFDDGAMGKETW